MVIYIAGKYSGSSKEEVAHNVKVAEEIGKLVLLRGHVPLIPHRISAHWEDCPEFTEWGHNDWLERFCFPLLEKADAILLLCDWESSKGAQLEMHYAEKLEKRCYKSLFELLLTN